MTRGLALLWRSSDRFAWFFPLEGNRALNLDSRNAANTGYRIAISDWVAHQGEPVRNGICNIWTPIEMSANSAYSVCIFICLWMHQDLIDTSGYEFNSL